MINIFFLILQTLHYIQIHSLGVIKNVIQHGS